MNKETKDNIAATTAPKKCGIIMPISSIDDCDSEHWERVSNIIKSSIENAGFKGEMVSYNEETRIIQKTIVGRLYNDEIVVCDLSCKNANVMFELGMRLIFDKPIVLIKDDKTGSSFDIEGMEYITYPRDLRYDRIEDFKKNYQKR